MSFWDTLGEIANTAVKASNPLLGVFDAARVAATTEDPREGDDSVLDNARQLGSAFFKRQTNLPVRVLTSEPVQAAMAPLVWTMHQASHGLSSTAAVGGMLADDGQTGIDNLWSRDLWDTDTWGAAWDASEGVSGGEALAFTQQEMLTGASATDAGRRWWDADDRAEFDRTRKETGFRLSAGALDIITTWYADPTIVVGKAAKLARAGDRIVDAAQADDVAEIIGKGMGDRTLADRAAGTFSSSTEETASRLWHHVSKTDNMGFAETAAHFKQNLERSGDAGPIIGILGQAGKIADLEVQRAVKADVLLAAAGSTKARDRLIANAPDLARAVQRASLPPESYQIVDDMVAAGVTGDALLEATGKWASKANAKELDAYAKDLDAIHTRLAGVAAVGRRGGVENVSGSVLGAVKSRYRAGMAREFFYQPGPHSRTVRVVHWASGQRMRGVIAVDDAVRGHDELMDTMMRSKLFSAEDRKAVADKWWQAPNKAARSDMAQALPEIILNKLATKHGLDREGLDRIIKSYKGWAGAARTYTTKQMEAARAGNLGRVVLEDPMTGTPTSIERALFETHIENNVGIPDVATLERLIRHASGAASKGDKLKDSAMWALNTAEDANDLWRTLTLARPGFMARTQFDTQARAAMTVGATAVVRNAVKGLGHKMTDKLKGEQVEQVEALASDLLRQQNLRREAAELHRQADVMDSGFGAARVDVEEIAPDPRTAMYPGGTPMFHGTSKRFADDKVDPDPYGGSGSENLFGYGFYTTADRGVANSYTAKGRGGQPVVYQVKWDGDGAPRVLDLETSRDPEIRKFIRGIIAADDESASLLSGAGARTAGADDMMALLDDPKVPDVKVLHALRRYLAEGGETPSSVADEIYMDLADILSQRFDAIAHTGGLYAGKGAGVKHEVKIWLNPGKVSVAAHSERTGKKLGSGTKTGSTSAAVRLRDRAKALEAEAADVVTYDATARRLVTQSRTMNIGGQKVTTRAAASEAEVQGLIPALHTGDASISDAILRTNGKLAGKFAEDASSWVTTMPEDVAWTQSWLRSKDAMMRSKAGRAIIDELDLPSVDMVRSLRRNPDVRAAWREVRDENPEFESWLDRAIAQVEWTAPTREVREALKSGRVLNEADVDGLFKPAGATDDSLELADRMPVHAPAMDVLDPRQHGIQSAYDMAKRFVRWMSDVPDTALGRVPHYTERYFHHYRELAEREIARNGELGLEARARLEQVSRHRAIQDTRQTMYDTARFTGAHDRVARMGFAFLGAWEDSMRAWGKMFYDDPARLGKLMKVWYAPERGGMIVDESGNPVRPGQEAREKWIVLPVQWIPGVDFEEFKIRKDSFNSMFQGDVPWAPGFGPGVQVPATQLAARVFPEIADPNFEIGGVKVGEHPLLRQLFGFGLPKTGATAMDQGGSMIDQVLPGWMRRAKNIIDGDSQQFTDAYAMSLNSELLKARADGKDPNSKSVLEAADKAARGTARSMMFLEFVSNYGLGLSGEGSTKADFYRQRYHEISTNAEALYARGSSPQEELLRQHPEVAGLKWSFSENKTGINATLKVEDRIRKFGKDIQKNPEFGWFFVGSDNVGGEFSAASYAAQFGREATPGSGETWRGRLDSAGIREKTAASLGWDEYYKIKDEIDAELIARGLHSLQQKGAEDLNDVMKTFRTELSAENPEWAKDYGSFDSDKMQTFLNQVAFPAMKDGRLKGRSDIKAMTDYLSLREEAMAMANENGYSLSSKSAVDLRAILLEAGQQMAQENIGFSQMWQRVFEREIDLAMDDFPAVTQPATSPELKF